MVVDFPNKPPLPAAVLAQNELLKARFAISAFPTLMLCDAEGRPYAEATYPDPVTTEVMMAELDEKRKVRLARDAKFELAAKAVGMDKAKLLIEGLKLVPMATVPLAYGDVVDEIAGLDPEDEFKFAKAAQIERRLFDLEAGFAELFKSEKFADASAYIEAFVVETKPEGEFKQKALMYKVYALAKESKFEEALALANQIIEIEPASQTAAVAKQIKSQMEAE